MITMNHSNRYYRDDQEPDDTDLLMTLKKPWKPNLGGKLDPKPSPRIRLSRLSDHKLSSLYRRKHCVYETK